jgi:xanthine dehydrogenase accessory factor
VRPPGSTFGRASPEEIAIINNSVLAEIIQQRGARAESAAETKNKALPTLDKGAKDPVCGMLVDVGSTKYKSERHGSMVYFCCARCKRAFDSQPDKYAVPVSA